MSVSIKFDGGQGYQKSAVSSVVDLFEGWDDSIAQQFRDEQVESLVDHSEALIQHTFVSNGWGVNEETLLANIHKIQARQHSNATGEDSPIIPLEMRYQPSPEPPRDFSIEMETGTGKTYVYIRTAIELYLKYGLSKFVIVVPSIAIREGVLSSLNMMKEHFKSIYEGLNYQAYQYSSRNLSVLRQFATSDQLQILVMNDAAFTGDLRIINRPQDNFGQRPPLDFITGVRPVVILDEPQKLKGAKQTEAISNLNALFRLRYSATLDGTDCLLYRLTPVDAYEMKLVKQIQVLSMTAEGANHEATVVIKKVTSRAGSITATALLNKNGISTNFTLKKDDDLEAKTGSPIYKGWIVEDIHAKTEDSPAYVEFQGHGHVVEGGHSGIDTDLWQKAQVTAAVEEHFATELRLRHLNLSGVIKKTKPLTLFFIDRVANYYPSDGKLRLWFEEAYEEVLQRSTYRNLREFMPRTKEVHLGYFAKTGDTPKDSSGNTADDAMAFEWIMRDKQALLSSENPVRFIFSHSALAEGWDNPNVFVICNLQEPGSEMRKRQQIGRGLRLPVMEDGERCRVEEANLLTVIASEDFQTFAAGLQNEIEKETGVVFNGIRDARTRVELELKPNFENLPGFTELWKSISPKTRYSLEFTTEDIISEAILRLQDLGREFPIVAPRIVKTKAQVDLNSAGVQRKGFSGQEPVELATLSVQHFDVLADLSKSLPVSRSTIYEVIEKSGRENDLRINAGTFIEQVKKAIRGALAHTLSSANGIHYYKIGDAPNAAWSAEFFRSQEPPPSAYEANLVTVNKSIYKQIPVDSQIEREFAMAIDERDDVILFIKLPSWYKIATPVGYYNPDWGIVKQDAAGDKSLYLVRETKGTTNVDELFREAEQWKVTFGRRHFEALGVSYGLAKTGSDIDSEKGFTPVPS